MFYPLFRRLLFALDAERAHDIASSAARVGQATVPGLLRAVYAYRHRALESRVFGLDFANPIGLAAGFDKNARLIRFARALGFGFTEVGSVSALAAPGNPRPRAFRLPEDRALINRMGLNNDGAEAIAARLAGRTPTPDFPLGINVVKTHDPEILGDAALDDFAASVRAMAPHASYLTLNVSCPNTTEGKTFEDPPALDGLLSRVFAELDEQHPPVLVKLGPPAGELDVGALSETIDVVRAHPVVGIVATNTASDRRGLRTAEGVLEGIGRGGLSGRPLAARAETMLRHLYRETAGELPLIGVGGIDSIDAAYARIRAGASLIQLYTGLVYEGPGLIGRIARGLVQRLERDGLSSIEDAVGKDA